MKIDGMICVVCVKVVERVVKKLDGVESISVNIVIDKVNIDYDLLKVKLF